MDPASATDPPLPLAAIAKDDAGRVDELLAAFVAEQRRAGRRVRGLLMRHRALHTGVDAGVDAGVDTEVDTGADCEMVLTDIDTGDEYLVSQDLGPGARGCRADPQGFARASRVLRDALEAAPDLVVCNRFGSLEAAGGGFIAELGELAARGIPVLTVVSPRHIASWQRFVGHTEPLLPPQPQHWQAWLDAV